MPSFAIDSWSWTWRRTTAESPKPSLADIDRLLAEIKATAGEGPLWNYGMAVRLWLGGEPKGQFDEAMKYAGGPADAA